MIAGETTDSDCVCVLGSGPTLGRAKKTARAPLGNRTEKKDQIVLFYGPHGKWRRCHKTNRSLYARAGKKGNIDIHVVGISPISSETFFLKFSAVVPSFPRN